MNKSLGRGAPIFLLFCFSALQAGPQAKKVLPKKQHKITAKKIAQPIISYQAPIPHWSLENKHQVLHVTPQDGKNHFITLGKDRYNLLNLHFHYPSEHTVNGKHLPLEAHFVHENARRELAVISVLIKEGKEANSLYSRLLSCIKNIVPFKTCKTNIRQSLDLATLLPSSTMLTQLNQTMAKGSMPGIRWLISRTPITLNKEQISTIKTCYQNKTHRI